jgi:putative glutamine amidotransferase
MEGMPTWRNNYDSVRDQFEHSLLQDAIAARLPILGICRGFHFLNWARGGTLRYLDTPYDNVQVHLPNLTVTCHHTIAIDALAPGFQCLLKDQHNVVELACDTANRILGIGWHPERAANQHTRSMILEKFYQL